MQITGRVTITISGQRYRSKEGAKLTVGGVERDAQISDGGVDGYSEKYSAPQVEFSLNHHASLSLKALQDMRQETLIFETDTGKIFTVREAFCEKSPTLTKGEVSLTFGGVECIEG